MSADYAATDWYLLWARLSLEVSVVITLAFAAHAILRTAYWRRAAWQVCAAALLGVALVELTGVSSGMITRLRAQKAESLSADSGGFGFAPEPEAALSEQFRSEVARRAALNRSEAGRTESSGVAPVQGASGFVFPQTASGVSSSAPTSTESPLDRLTDSTAAPVFFAAAWFVGTLVLLLRMGTAASLIWVLRTCGRAVEHAELPSLLCGLGIKRRIRVIESRRCTSPVAFGVFRPIIALPEGFSGAFGVAEQRVMLAHELAHVAARDPFWQLVFDFSAALLWWHPLVWFARRQLRSSAETAADEASLLVANGPHVLAECLVTLGSRLPAQPAVGWMGVGGFRSGLGKRVERLLQLRNAKWRRPPAALSNLATSSGFLAAILISILCTASVHPSAFKKGDSMNTLKQTWKTSIAALALLYATGDASAAADRERTESGLGGGAASGAAGSPFGPANADKNDEAGSLDTGSRSTSRGRSGGMTAPRPGGSGYSRYASGASGFGGRASERSIDAKLGIIIDEAPSFDGLPLSEVAKYLNDEVRRRDPEKRGINFILSNTVTPQPMGPVMDPATGVPMSSSDSDIGSVLIRFNLPLRHVRVLDVLDAIVRVADKPIQYSVEEYGVVFQPASHWSSGYAGAPFGAMPVQVRTFRIDHQALVSGLEHAFGISIAETPVKAQIESEKLLIQRDQAQNEIDSVKKQVDVGAADAIALERAKMTLALLDAKDEGQRLQLQISLADRELERAKRMFETGAISTAELEKAKAAKALLEADMKLWATLERYPQAKAAKAAHEADMKLREAGAGKQRSAKPIAQTRAVQDALRKLLVELGVNLDQPNKAVFYNSLTGVIMVRATTDELDVVQAAVETLGGAQNVTYGDNALMRRYGMGYGGFGAAGGGGSGIAFDPTGDSAGGGGGIGGQAQESGEGAPKNDPK